MGDTLLNPCSAISPAIGGLPVPCSGGVINLEGVCTFNPFFLLFAASAQLCICPPRYYLGFDYTTAPNIQVNCRSITGSPCRTDLDCKSRTMDCLGISSFSQVNFDGSGLMSPIAQDLVDILLPVATLLCGFSDLYRTSSIPLFSCNGVSSGVIGQCQEVKTTLVRIRSENFPDRTWGLDQNGDAFINQGFSGNIFYVVPGLTGQPGTVSFNSVEYPCSYLRHFNFALRLESSQNPANPEIYNEDATFYPRPNQFIPGFTAYESVNFPGQFIRHLGFRLLLNTNDGSPLFARDASFSIENIDLLQSCNN